MQLEIDRKFIILALDKANGYKPNFLWLLFSLGLCYIRKFILTTLDKTNIFANQ